MTMLPVHEVFTTFQGEGLNSGRGAFFIRLFGCPVHCSFCDSAGTWHKDWIPKEVQKADATVLVTAALESKQKLVVLTGGEPAIHDLTELCRSLKAAGFTIAIETCGHFPLKDDGLIDHVTISPKWAALPLCLETTARCTEWKLIIEERFDVGRWWEQVFAFWRGSAPVYLHPEWSKRGDRAVLDQITYHVKAQPWFRAGWQLHKLYQSDQLDPRSQPVVPLGGRSHD